METKIPKNQANFFQIGHDSLISLKILSPFL